MARKGTRPALYELMRIRRAADEARSHKPQPEPSPRSQMAPGRTIRLPIGYLFVAAAVLLAAVVVAYIVGYSRGERVAQATDWQGSQPPLLGVPPPETVQPPAPTRQPQRGVAESGSGATAAGPILSDPRQPGRNYFVLIHTQRDNAIELGRFCRAHGLEAYVVRAKNVSLYRVIVLPGYERGARASEGVRALEQRIVEVANKWRLQVNPRDDLAYYPEKYDG